MDLFTRSLNAEPDEILIQVDASVVRRSLGTVALLSLCILVLWHGVNRYMAEEEGLLPIVLALAGIYAGLCFWKSTDTGLVLTPTELREANGRQVITMADVASVERTAFGIIKPTNGFVIVSRRKLTAAALPGLWWRLGKIIAVGGLTGTGEGKAMAELMQEMVSRQKQE